MVQDRGPLDAWASALIYQWCEAATEAVLYSMIVFSPWAFGTTQAWSISIMNAGGYALGLLLAVKWLCRKIALPSSGSLSPAPSGGKGWGEGALRSLESPLSIFRRLWDHEPGRRPEAPAREAAMGSRAVPWSRAMPWWFGRTLAALTILILVYCLVYVLNARARYLPESYSFEYYSSYIPWLPHSYDWDRSLASFWRYLAIALSFWAVHDWLMGDAPSNPRRRVALSEGRGSRAFPGLPGPRLTRLLWVLSINGAVLAFQGLLQRADGGAKLLWFMETHLNRQATSQFGPYAYRSNAAQYFNLLWPAMLGFWWWIEQSAQRVGSRSARHRVLIPLLLLVALCPILSLSRAGAAVTLLLIAAAGVILLFSFQGPRLKVAAWTCGAILVIVCLSIAFNAADLLKRFQTSSIDLLEGRERTYITARKIWNDFPLFGTGPGTFEHVFQLYRKDLDEFWPAQVHNDWLETGITFGWAGLSLIGLALVVVLLRWQVSGRRGEGGGGIGELGSEGIRESGNQGMTESGGLPSVAVWGGFGENSGIHAPWTFPAMLVCSLGGCLVHARVDFPFQIYSVLFLFVLLCSILFSMGKGGAGGLAHETRKGARDGREGG